MSGISTLGIPLNSFGSHLIKSFIAEPTTGLLNSYFAIIASGPAEPFRFLLKNNKFASRLSAAAGAPKETSLTTAPRASIFRSVCAGSASAFKIVTPSRGTSIDRAEVERHEELNPAAVTKIASNQLRLRKRPDRHVLPPPRERKTVARPARV